MTAHSPQVAKKAHDCFCLFCFAGPEIAQLVGQRDFGPPHHYAHTNYVTIIFPSQSCLFPFYTILICGHSQSARFFIYLFKCTGIMGQDLVHPYIQSTTVHCDQGKPDPRTLRILSLRWHLRRKSISIVVSYERIAVRTPFAFCDVLFLRAEKSVLRVCPSRPPYTTVNSQPSVIHIFSQLALDYEFHAERREHRPGGIDKRWRLVTGVVGIVFSSFTHSLCLFII